MKFSFRILLTAVLSLIFLPAGTYAQWQTVGANIYYNAGNLGVGTENPESILHINQMANHEGILITESNNSEKIHLNLARFDDGREYGYLSLGGDTKLRGNGEKSYFDGDVGIGTTNPTSKLTVNGKVKAEEVIVDENIGADFVFEEDYDLPKLKEVESHIRNHKHLPGVPSAEEMKETGVKVGDLQMKLLQKIEELTLYTIEQQELIKKQENGIKQLSSQLKEQQKLIDQLRNQ